MAKRASNAGGTKRAAKPRGVGAPGVKEGGATEGEAAGAKGGAKGGGGGGGGGRGGRGGGRFGPSRGLGLKPGDGKNRHLVIVESPSKAKTINKYLGPQYLVVASIGHVRDLPSKNPKGVKSPVPGVDLERGFRPTYEVLSGKDKVIAELKRAAKECLASGREIWFATDLDREGEAIAWHLAQELGVDSKSAKRVVFAAITKSEIEKAFGNPHPIDEDRVNAQQARRILDRIVGYQVSPLLWKKVARGLSAGRVQSVAVRLVVEREREIRAFVPEELWSISGQFTADVAGASGLAGEWSAFMARRDEKGNAPTVKMQNAWLGERGGIGAELVEVGGEKVGLEARAGEDGERLAARAREVAELAGLRHVRIDVRRDPKGRGPAQQIRTLTGEVDPATPYEITGIETKRTSSRPGAPYITSTLQQAAANRLGFGAQRTMKTAQQLYEGIDIPGEGPVGLITYMRTDSTNISRDALEMVRSYIERSFGAKYLPEKPNFYSSSNKGAQEAHEAIRPTSLEYPPSKVKRALSEDQFRLYTLIWERFVSCQMTPAQWDSTAVTIRGGKDPKRPVTFRATGRTLVFDGFYRVSGVPKAADEQMLPAVSERQRLAPFSVEPVQKFTSPPPRYTEASLIKMLESEGIGRPSTYASIISVIQDRNYVEQQERRFYATDLGEVVTDKLVEAFPKIMDVGYTREMEQELDKVEEEHLDWVEMLNRFYGPFTDALEHAHETMGHAKAELVPAPDEYKCPTCGAPTVYRFGKNGRFLSCSTYPACNYASPVDREGVPRPAAQTVPIACIKCGAPMTKRVGRFGPFLGCSRYGDKTNPCDGILNIDRKGKVVAPSPPALLTELPCPACQSPLNLRNGVRGPWLGCSRFPKCRGRGKWAELDEPTRADLMKKLEHHELANRAPIVKTTDGRALTDASGKPLASAPTVDALAGVASGEGSGDGEESVEVLADEVGV
ncbi:MAG: type I DNA topoisomerase [Phycisphaeraceae bacterium]|nr:type I DNA topoisomerase [Phycisphaeraceae bacterium]